MRAEALQLEAFTVSDERGGHTCGELHSGWRLKPEAGILCQSQTCVSAWSIRGRTAVHFWSTTRLVLSAYRTSGRPAMVKWCLSKEANLPKAEHPRSMIRKATIYPSECWLVVCSTTSTSTSHSCPRRFLFIPSSIALPVAFCLELPFSSYCATQLYVAVHNDHTCLNDLQSLHRDLPVPHDHCMRH